MMNHRPGEPHLPLSGGGMRREFAVSDLSRRQMLGGSIAALGCSLAAKVRAVEASPITPALIDAAKAEGKLAFYTAMPEPMRGHRVKALSKTLAAEVAEKRKRIEQSIPKGSA